MKEYVVIYEQAEHNWCAYVPDLPGCITTGPTLSDTRANIKEAIEGHVQVMRETGESIPEPTSIADTIPVAA